MTESLKKLLMKERLFQISLLLFAALSGWWFYLQLIEGSDTSKNLIWGALYQLVALWGGIWGLIISRKWGGIKSVMGRAILSFAFGLLFQVLGQSVFSFYNLVLQIEIPYPSLADIGFFGSIPLYIYGILMLARASGVTVSLRSFGNKIQAFLIPLVMLGLSYWFFLKSYEFDWTSPLRIFLDFGYPLGQAIYVSIAILTYLLSKKILGGVMKTKVLFILVALIVQYAADYNFLYQAAQGTWVNGGYGDYIYLFAYFLMTMGLLQLEIKHVRSNE